jgi:hypothetical protein
LAERQTVGPSEEPRGDEPLQPVTCLKCSRLADDVEATSWGYVSNGRDIFRCCPECADANRASTTSRVLLELEENNDFELAWLQTTVVRCMECGAEIDEDEAQASRWGYWMDGIGALHPLCPTCASREFGARRAQP